MKHATLLAAAALAAFPAHALTGNEALQQAKRSETALHAYTTGLIEAEVFNVENVKQLVAAGIAPAQQPFCTPAGATAGQGWAIVAKFMGDNPQVTHNPLGSIARVALVRAWPCS